MERLKAVLFDLDCTLIDTREYILNACFYAIEQSGNTAADSAVIADAIKKPLREVYLTLYPDQDPEPLMRLHREYQDAHLDDLTLYPKTAETLAVLDELGLRAGIVTSRTSDSTRRCMDAVCLTGFHPVITRDDVTHAKPDPESVHKAIAILGLQPNEVIMIGDTAADIQAGKAAGVRATIGVTHGFDGDAIQNSEPDYTIDELSELIPIVLGLLEQIR